MTRTKTRVAFELQALGVGSATKALKKVNDRFKRIEGRLTKVNEKLKTKNSTLARVGEKFNKIGLAATRAGERFSRAGVNDLRRFNIGLYKVNKSLLKMKRHYKSVGSSLKPLLSKINKVGKASRSAGIALTLGVTASLGLMGGSAISASANFESAMNKVQVLTKGVSFNALEKEAMRLGATTAFSATEAGDAMSYLAMAGFNSNQILGSMAPTLNLASAGGLELAASADIVSNVLTGYGLSVDKIGSATDSLVGAFSESNTSLSQLGESMKVAGPIASSLNIPLNETLSILGAMGNAGYQGERAGTAMAGGLSRLIKPVKEVKSALKGLGINLKDITDKNGQVSSLTKVLGLLEAKGATTADYLRIFGQEAGKAFVALKKQGTGAIRELEKKIKNSTGRAEEIAKAMNKGANGAIKSLKSAIEGLQIAIAKSGLLDWFTKITKKAAAIIRKLSTLNPVLLRYATITGIVVAAIGPMLLVFSQMVFMVGKAIFVFKFLGPLILASAKVMAIFAIKAILIAAAIGAVVYAGWFLVKNWQKITALMGKAWLGLKEKVLSILEVIDPNGVLKSSLLALYGHWQWIIGKMGDVWKSFISSVSEFWNSIASKFGGESLKFDVKETKTESLTSKIMAEIKSADFDYNPIKGVTDEFSKVMDAFNNPFGKEDKAPVLKEAPLPKNVIPFPKAKVGGGSKIPEPKAVLVSSVMPNSALPMEMVGQREEKSSVSGLFNKLKNTFSSLVGSENSGNTSGGNFSYFDKNRFSEQPLAQKESIEIVVDFKNILKNTDISVHNPYKIPVRVNQGLALDREFG